MRMARHSLRMLDQLSSDPVIKLAFLEQPLVKRGAYASVAFINKLAGPLCKNLEVASAAGCSCLVGFVHQLAIQACELTTCE